MLTRLVADRAGRWLAGVRVWFIVGVLGSALGFALPWFRVSRSYEWWYGGWHLVTTNEPDLWWISLIFLGYAILLCAGVLLPRLDALTTGLLAALAIAVALGSLVVIALAAADAVTDLGRVYRLDLNVGLFVLLPAHGLMIVAGVAALMLQLARELVAVAAPLSRTASAAPRDESGDHAAQL
jgi:hypothetical protein